MDAAKDLLSLEYQSFGEVGCEENGRPCWEQSATDVGSWKVGVLFSVTGWFPRSLGYATDPDLSGTPQTPISLVRRRPRSLGYVADPDLSGTSQTPISRVRHRPRSLGYVTDPDLSGTSQTPISRLCYRSLTSRVCHRPWSLEYVTDPDLSTMLQIPDLSGVPQTLISRVRHRSRSLEYVTDPDLSGKSQTSISVVHHRHWSLSYITDPDLSSTSQIPISRVRHRPPSRHSWCPVALSDNGRIRFLFEECIKQPLKRLLCVIAKLRWLSVVSSSSCHSCWRKKYGWSNGRVCWEGPGISWKSCKFWAFHSHIAGERVVMCWEGRYRLWSKVKGGKVRLKRTWMKKVEEESEMVGLWREDALCQPKWSVGVNQIAAGLRWIWPPSLVGGTTWF